MRRVRPQGLRAKKDARHRQVSGEVRQIEFQPDIVDRAVQDRVRISPVPGKRPQALPHGMLQPDRTAALRPVLPGHHARSAA